MSAPTTPLEDAARDRARSRGGLSGARRRRGPAGGHHARAPAAGGASATTRPTRALLLAPRAGRLAARGRRSGWASELGRRLGGELERIEVAGPGFLNLFLGDALVRRALVGRARGGERFGVGGAPAPERI